ncbi:MAG: hypothetical protein H7834_14620, partial [Magnetococcus sp. YQC-9]
MKISDSKPHPARNVSFLLVKKKRGSGRFISQGFAFDFSALFDKKHFSRLLRKMRRAPPSRESFPPFGNDSRILHAALRKTTHPKMGAV